MAPYPTRDEISKIFTSLADGDTETFLSHVSPTVKWDVLGIISTQPITKQKTQHSAK